MNKPMENWTSLRLQRVRNALKKHNIPSYYCENIEDLKDLVSSFIKEGSHVCTGGSMTLEETGIIDLLKMMPIHFTARDLSASKQEQKQRAREAFSADTFLCSASAVTLQGEIFNVDGNGNRLAPIIYGPDQVLLIVSENKIVEDMNEAVQRIKSLSAPTNAMRLHCDTPCCKTGKCEDCRSPQRICSFHVMIDWQREQRIKVIFVKGSYGY